MDKARNPMMDAIKRLKANRVAVIVGDADELGLTDQVSMPGQDEFDIEREEDFGGGEEDPNAAAQKAAAMDQEAEDSEDPQSASPKYGPEDAEKLMGRKPFGRGGSPSLSSADDEDPELAEEVAGALRDERTQKRLEGRKPKNLAERAQAAIAKRFGK